MKDESVKLSCSMEPLSNNDFSHVFFATLGLIAFTLALEFISHERIDYCTTISDMDDHGGTTHNDTRTEALMRAVVEEQPQPRQTPAATTPQSSAEQLPNTAPKKTNPPVGTCCLPDASPNVRANRLITAIFLYAVIVTLFVIRIRDATIPHLRRECASYTSSKIQDVEDELVDCRAAQYHTVCMRKLRFPTDIRRLRACTMGTGPWIWQSKKGQHMAVATMPAHRCAVVRAGDIPQGGVSIPDCLDDGSVTQ